MKYLVTFMMQKGTYTLLPEDQNFSGDSFADVAAKAKSWYDKNPSLFCHPPTSIFMTNENFNHCHMSWDRISSV